MMQERPKIVQKWIPKAPGNISVLNTHPDDSEKRQVEFQQVDEDEKVDNVHTVDTEQAFLSDNLDDGLQPIQVHTVEHVETEIQNTEFMDIDIEQKQIFGGTSNLNMNDEPQKVKIPVTSQLTLSSDTDNQHTTISSVVREILQNTKVATDFSQGHGNEDFFNPNVTWSSPVANIAKVTSEGTNLSPLLLARTVSKKRLESVICKLNTEDNISSAGSSHLQKDSPLKVLSTSSAAESSSAPPDPNIEPSSSDEEMVDDSSVEEEHSSDPPYLPDWGVEDEISAGTEGLIIKSQIL